MAKLEPHVIPEQISTMGIGAKERLSGAIWACFQMARYEAGVQLLLELDSYPPLNNRGARIVSAHFWDIQTFSIAATSS